MCPDSTWRIDADAFMSKIHGIREQFLWKHARLDDALPVIDIVDEEVERLDALLQPGLDARPFMTRDDARDDVERPGPIDASALLGIDREGDAHGHDGEAPAAFFRSSISLLVSKPK